MSTSLRVMLFRRERKVGFVAALGCMALGGKRCSDPTDDTKAMISTPCANARYFSAMAPAATRPIVSRAEERPPPDEARIPYFSWYVKSACEGLG